MFAQRFGVAKQFGYSLDHRENLIPADERVQRNSKIRLSRKSATNAQSETYLRLATNHALDCRQPDIVDLRIRTPDPAPCDRNLELAWQIVELGIARQHAIPFQSERRCVANLIRIHSGDGAACYVACDVAASAG